VLVKLGGKEVGAAEDNIVAQFTAPSADIEHGETRSTEKSKSLCPNPER